VPWRITLLENSHRGLLTISFHLFPLKQITYSSGGADRSHGSGERVARPAFYQMLYMSTIQANLKNCLHLREVYIFISDTQIICIHTNMILPTAIYAKLPVCHARNNLKVRSIKMKQNLTNQISSFLFAKQLTKRLIYRILQIKTDLGINYQNCNLNQI
jgi:hypothetical protein